MARCLNQCQTYTIRKTKLLSLKNENRIHSYAQSSTYGSIEKRLLEQPKHKLFPRLMSMRTHLCLNQFQILSLNFATCNFSVSMYILMIIIQTENTLLMGSPKDLYWGLCCSLFTLMTSSELQIYYFQYYLLMT